MKQEPGYKATLRSTVLLVGGMAVTSVVVSRALPSDMAHTAALGAGTTLAVSFLADLRGAVRNLVRADVMALCALYFLTLFEFLLPQPIFDQLVVPEEVGPAINACLLGFAGIALGRHFAPPAPFAIRKLLKTEFPTGMLLTLFWISFALGFFYQLFSVNFNFADWMMWIMAPRFSQPWSRGRLGDWRALLGELGMIINLAPPIAGIILARRRQYAQTAVITVTAALLFVFMHGFMSGTRNVLVTYVATFAVAYAFTLEPGRRREMLFVTGFSVASLLAATVFMLEFRTVGFANYMRGEGQELAAAAEAEAKTSKGLFVDYNLYVIAKLTTVFPERHEYLGFEIPYLSIIRPIPRAIWSGKPEGLSLGIEDALGVEGLTLAASVIGEAYISGGLIGVALTGFVFGIIFGWWNRFGDPNNSPFGHLVYASGFFAAVISMRSMFVFTTAMLPTVAALVLGSWLLSRVRRPVRTTPEES